MRLYVELLLCHAVPLLRLQHMGNGSRGMGEFRKKKLVNLEGVTGTGRYTKGEALTSMSPDRGEKEWYQERMVLNIAHICSRSL